MIQLRSSTRFRPLDALRALRALANDPDDTGQVYVVTPSTATVITCEFLSMVMLTAACAAGIASSENTSRKPSARLEISTARRMLN